MQDIPVVLNGYNLMVVEAPVVKTKELESGELVSVTNRDGVEQYVVSLFAKPVPRPGERGRKGEEIKVNLPGDPGEGFEEGSYVELVNPVLNTYEMRGEGNQITAAGIWWKADGLKPAARRNGLVSAA
ncbi:hypothetical protein GCM10012275_49040 [Longimycelium tulufanense]|uniref:Uncharacterized protein n=1 Tax=Longimycelium tulufanense TaxID=907463 RepID=A0A8J3FVY7_9PSEU|nr:hypothetical protein [Longimycelium tulufanense]GGM72627.1 hypothetical protein GCM10012275_49040 [Longimycelium tulufanense]